MAAAPEIWPDQRVKRLHQVAETRAALGIGFRTVWPVVTGAGDRTAVEDWCAGSLALLDVNAGPSSLLAFWTATRALSPSMGIAGLGEIGRIAAGICRESGVQGVLAVLRCLPDAVSGLKDGDDPATLCSIFLDLAGRSPDAVAPAAAHIGTLLRHLDLAGLRYWIDAGLRATAGRRQEEIAYFTLRHPLAQKLLKRSTSAADFPTQERALSYFLLALWGIRPAILPMEADNLAPERRRSRFSGNIILMPDRWTAGPGGGPIGDTRLLYRASAAHIAAHRMFSETSIPVEKLKPIQIAAISLIEDARVEHLAMERYPGLRRLWQPFHVAHAEQPDLIASLTARLARALFDPAYEDANSWVQRGRALFQDLIASGGGHETSRRIGGLLGNDLGQMRLQFNPKSYLVEPVYRDDNQGLWEAPDLADQPTIRIELATDSVRIERRDDSDADNPDNDAPPEEAPNHAHDAGASSPTSVEVARYPEWDHAAEVTRPDWTTVHEVDPPHGDLAEVDRLLNHYCGEKSRVAAVVRSVRVGRPTRLRRRFEGEQLDLDACIDATLSLRAGVMPDPRLYQTKVRRHRDVAVLVLLDTSQSTAERIPRSKLSVLDCARAACVILDETLSELGDRLAIWGFASAGRNEVRITRIKDFDEPDGAPVHARIAGMRSGFSTRMGAAIRHGSALLERQSNFRRLLLVITDGEASDIDVPDPRYLAEDARQAVTTARARGVDVHCLSLSAEHLEQARLIFGQPHCSLTSDVSQLPERLALVYFRLAMR